MEKVDIGEELFSICPFLFLYAGSAEVFLYYTVYSAY